MSPKFPRLQRNQQRGSKPRCHLLTHGAPEAVAARLTALAAPFATIGSADQWMPHGFDQTDEATLPIQERQERIRQFIASFRSAPPTG